MIKISSLKKIAVLSFLFLFAALSYYKIQKQSFTVTSSDQGILIEENGKKVLFYQKELHSLKGKYFRNNYIHPLYDLNGDTLTADFPEDHPYHRGVFWAWHYIAINDSVVSDQWILKNYSCRIKSASASIENSNVVIRIEALWSSPEYMGNNSYLKEQTKITVHPQSENIRIIDFKIMLLSLLEGLKIAGSQDKKGYGGFCLRIVTPNDLIFMSDSGFITPQEFQIAAGSWMDFSGTFGKKGKISGITLFCHPDNPNYPEPWILRQKRSMQNVVYPGQKPVEVSDEKPSVLNYRIIIHNGRVGVKDINTWENNYKSEIIN